MFDNLLNNLRNNLQNISIIGLVIMFIAAIMVYGAKIIVLKIFRFPYDESIRPIIILKLAGILVAVVGMLKIFEII